MFRGEDGTRRSLSYADLHDRVARLAAALEAAGIGPGAQLDGVVPAGGRLLLVDDVTRHVKDYMLAILSLLHPEEDLVEL